MILDASGNPLPPMREPSPPAILPALRCAATLAMLALAAMAWWRAAGVVGVVILAATVVLSLGGAS